jgi:phage baseplate assembly protein W
METATLQLPKDLIEAAIQQNVAAAMAKAMGGYSSLMAEAVNRVLNQKVDDDGKPSNYSSNIPFIQWAVNDALRKAVQDALAQEVVKYEAEVRRQIVEQLGKKNSPIVKQLVENMTSGLIEAATNKYRLTVTVA